MLKMKWDWERKGTGVTGPNIFIIKTTVGKWTAYMFVHHKETDFIRHILTKKRKEKSRTHAWAQPHTLALTEVRVFFSPKTIYIVPLYPHMYKVSFFNNRQKSKIKLNK